MVLRSRSDQKGFSVFNPEVPISYEHWDFPKG